MQFRAMATAGMMLAAVPGWAADYPAKPIRLIVPYAAGDAADLMGRFPSATSPAGFSVNPSWSRTAPAAPA